MTADTLSASGLTLTANATSGIVTIQSLTPATTMGINNAGSTLNLTSANLALITAKTLQFGTAANTGGVIIGAITMPANVGNVVVTSGSLDVTGFGAVAVNGAVSGASGNLTLNATAADVYLESGTMSIGTLTANAVTSVISSASFAYNNTSGTVSLSSSGVDVNNASIGLGSAMTAGTLRMSGPGQIYQQTGAFKVTNLLVQGGTLIDLSGGNNTNQITNFAANTTGRIKLLDNVNLVIASVNDANGVSVAGVTANQFNLSFASTGKNVTQTAAITANELSVVSGGTGNFVVTATLTNPGNSIGSFAAAVTSTGTVSLSGVNGLNVGQLFDAQGNQIANGVTAGTLTLSNTGTVTQSSRISATNLALLGAGGAYTLLNTTNTFTNFAANTGSINVFKTAAFTAGGTAGGTSGITTTGTVTLSSGAALTIGGAINSGGAVSLKATTSVAVNANVTATNGSQISILPDITGTGLGTSAVTFLNGTVKATASIVAIYYNTFTDNSANVVGTYAPYQYVSTLAGLQAMQNNLTIGYALNKDIDASSSASMNGGAGFEPIGSAATPFTGNFDGLNHTITGLVINRPGTNFVGLFGSTNGANIANVGLVGGSVTGGVGVGGLVGAQNNGSITASYSSAAVNGNIYVGGLVGFQSGTPTISRSYVTGAVSGNSTVGGLVGSQNGDINQSYATGAVTGGDTVGGLVGSQSSGTITASYWDIETSGVGIHNGVGDVTDAAGVTGLTSADFANTSSFAGWTFGTTPGGSGWVIVDADSTLNNAGGATGATRPFLLTEASSNGTITNAHLLQLLALNLAGTYILGGNIEMSETANAAGLWFSAGFKWAAARQRGVNRDGFGGSENHDRLYFLEGLHRNLRRPEPHDQQSLYQPAEQPISSACSAMCPRQTIKNVALTGGSVTGRDYVGGLTGEADWINAAGHRLRKRDFRHCFFGCECHRPRLYRRPRWLPARGGDQQRGPASGERIGQCYGSRTMSAE